MNHTTVQKDDLVGIVVDLDMFVVEVKGKDLHQNWNLLTACQHFETDAEQFFSLHQHTHDSQLV